MNFAPKTPQKNSHYFIISCTPSPLADEAENPLGCWINSLIPFPGWEGEKGWEDKNLRAAPGLKHCRDFASSPRGFLPIPEAGTARDAPSSALGDGSALPGPFLTLQRLFCLLQSRDLVLQPQNRGGETPDLPGELRESWEPCRDTKTRDGRAQNHPEMRQGPCGHTRTPRGCPGLQGSPLRMSTGSGSQNSQECVLVVPCGVWVEGFLGFFGFFSQGTGSWPKQRWLSSVLDEICSVGSLGSGTPLTPPKTPGFVPAPLQAPGFGFAASCPLLVCAQTQNCPFHPKSSPKPRLALSDKTRNDGAEQKAGLGSAVPSLSISAPAANTKFHFHFPFSQPPEQSTEGSWLPISPSHTWGNDFLLLVIAHKFCVQCSECHQRQFAPLFASCTLLG